MFMLYPMASGLIFIKKQNKTCNIIYARYGSTQIGKKKNRLLRWWFWCFYPAVWNKHQKTSVHSHTVPKCQFLPHPHQKRPASVSCTVSKSLESWGPRLSQLLLYSQCQVQYTLAYLTFKNLFKSTLRHLLVGYTELLNFRNNGIWVKEKIGMEIRTQTFQLDLKSRK